MQWCQHAAMLALEIRSGLGKLHYGCLSTVCWRVASAQSFGITLNLFELVGSGDGSLWYCKNRAQRLCQRCDANTVNNIKFDTLLCYNGFKAADA